MTGKARGVPVPPAGIRKSSPITTNSSVSPCCGKTEESIKHHDMMIYCEKLAQYARKRKEVS